MPFNVLVGAGFFVDQKVDRSIINLINGKDMVLVGNGNTMITKAFRLQEKVVKKLEEAGAKKALYVELNSRNMSLLKRTDIIYIMGGDTKELLELYQNDLFKSILKKHLKKGLLIAEGEAACLLSNRIDWYLKECCHITDKKYQSVGLLKENIYIGEDDDCEEEVLRYEQKYQLELKVLHKDECFFTTSITDLEN